MKFSLRTKLKLCVLVVGTALACCLSRNSLAALNTSEDFLVKGQPALVSSPRVVVFSTNSMTVGTNRITLGTFPSWSATEYLLINTDIVPKTVTFQMSTNGGSTWQTPQRTGNSVLFGVYASSQGVVITNVTIYGYSVKFSQTNSLAGQTLLVDDPVQSLAVANKKYVDNSIASYDPDDWALFPATDAVNVNGKGVLLNDAFSIETANGSLRSASVKAFGTDLLKFESSSITSGSNVTSQIVVTDTNVTIKVTASGITSRPVVFHKYSLDDPQWQLVSSITNVVENYPSATGGLYTVTFGRIVGDNWFTVFLESTNTTRRVTVGVPFFISNGGTVAGNMIFTNDVEVLGGFYGESGTFDNSLQAHTIIATSSFSGPGTGLTGIPASGLATGSTLPVLNAVNITNLPASGLAGSNTVVTASSFGTNFIVDFAVNNRFIIARTTNIFLVASNISRLASYGAITVTNTTSGASSFTFNFQTNTFASPSGQVLTMTTNASAHDLITVFPNPSNTRVYFNQTLNLQ